MHNYNFVRVGCAAPELKIGNCEYNVKMMIEMGEKARKDGVEVLLFPELGITGYTCGDLFYQKNLQKNALEALEKLLIWSKDNALVMIIGMPLLINGSLYNCGVVLQKERILGIVPKTYIPNDQEFYEKRWFVSGSNLLEKEIYLLDQLVPIGTDLLFKHRSLDTFIFGIEICEDLWAPIPPGSYTALAGATVIFNPSASNEVIGKSDYRKDLVRIESGRRNVGYLYTSSGYGESTGDLVFGGHALICQHGVLVRELPQFHLGNEMIMADLDLELIVYNRQIQSSFSDSKPLVGDKKFRWITFDSKSNQNYLETINPTPFVPDNENLRNHRCEEIFNIQTMALGGRVQKIGIPEMVVGISGGLDSTMALLVCLNVCEKFKIPRTKIHGVTMPGFGTTDRTYDNAVALVKGLGATFHEISIVDACKTHFEDIGHDINIHDTTFENAQARERTQILMDLSNEIGGIVVGTGDLSELALGWATYNGDHMSMYGVNSGIPKTLIKYLVRWVADHTKEKNIQSILYDILETPVSPELLPPHLDGEIKQKTEELVGPYELHDFFLFNMIRNGFSPEKIYFLGCQSFEGVYEKATVLKWLKVFYNRFFSQQFKRSCVPDGPKIGSVCLSPRGDWRMPSDAVVTQWLEALEEIK
ncbi:MAG: NAD(+) synthase [Eubacteriaceae bacterium]